MHDSQLRQPVTVIRNALEADVAEIQRIYAHHVRHGAASFEEEPPPVEEIARRRADILAHGLPYLVAEIDGAVAGYCYASPYRTRSAYRYTLENSVYIRHDRVGGGLGHRLMSELIARCAAGGWRQMVAVIGDSGNLPSIRLHERLGFERVGVLRSVGYKFARWTDSVLMQRELASGDGTPPAW